MGIVGQIPLIRDDRKGLQTTWIYIRSIRMVVIGRKNSHRTTMPTNNIEYMIETTVEELLEDYDDYSESDNQQAVFDESNWIVEESNTRMLFMLLDEYECLEMSANGGTIETSVKLAAQRVIEDEIQRRIEERR